MHHVWRNITHPHKHAVAHSHILHKNLNPNIIIIYLGNAKISKFTINYPTLLNAAEHMDMVRAAIKCTISEFIVELMIVVSCSRT